MVFARLWFGKHSWIAFKFLGNCFNCKKIRRKQFCSRPTCYKRAS